MEKVGVDTPVIPRIPEPPPPPPLLPYTTHTNFCKYHKEASSDIYEITVNSLQ
jgi:hypothetical protein